MEKAVIEKIEELRRMNEIGDEEVELKEEELALVQRLKEERVERRIDMDFGDLYEETGGIIQSTFQSTQAEAEIEDDFFFEMDETYKLC